jgi:hypothetical protein
MLSNLRNNGGYEMKTVMAVLMTVVTVGSASAQLYGSPYSSPEAERLRQWNQQWDTHIRQRELELQQEEQKRELDRLREEQREMQEKMKRERRYD